MLYNTGERILNNINGGHLFKSSDISKTSSTNPYLFTTDYRDMSHGQQTHHSTDKLKFNDIS